MTAEPDLQPESPFNAIGGAPVVRQIVHRFYDLMESDPSYADLRAIHAPDLTPMRASLAGFLDGWLGGPRDWFEAHPGQCMMSMHAAVPVSTDTARQWVEVMGRA
ncbi:MAG: globin [Phenylobacterium zucineum]|nr:MAG: globin [Phenylobacterium zucineum]